MDLRLHERVEPGTCVTIGRRRFVQTASVESIHTLQSSTTPLVVTTKDVPCS